MGIFARELTRDALWDAFLARRVYAATGDNIDAKLFVDGGWIGSTIQSNATRDLAINVKSADALGRIDLYKNDQLLKQYRPQSKPSAAHEQTWKLRVTWGWGKRDTLVNWNGELHVEGGEIVAVTTCFRGEAIVSPKEGASHEEVPDDQDLPHELLEVSSTHCAWRSSTRGNLSMRHATTQSLLLELRAPLDAGLRLSVNGREYRHSLQELRQGARSHYLKGWLTEAVQVGPLASDDDCSFETTLQDEPEADVDRYRLEVHQKNGQCAWLTPIWAER